MGLFSSKKTYYSSGVTREPLMDEYPDPFKMSIIQAVVAGGDLVTALKAATAASMSASANKYLQYGRTSFDYRLPTSNTGLALVDTDAVINIVTDIAGGDITISRIELEVADSGIGLAYSVSYADTAELIALQERKDAAALLVATVTDAVVVLVNDLSSVVFTVDTVTTNAIYESILADAEVAGTISSTDHAAIYQDIQASPDVIVVIVAEVLDAQNNVVVAEVLGVDDVASTADASTAGGVSAGTNNNIFEVTQENTLAQEEVYEAVEWYYELQEGTYSQLGTATTLQDTYLPVVPIKENRAYIDESSTLYSSGDALLGKLGLKTQAFKDAIDDADVAEEDVVGLFYAFTADFKSENTATIKYLFSLWEKEYETAPSILKFALMPRVIEGHYVDVAGIGPFGTPGKVFIAGPPPPTKVLTVSENTFDTNISYSGLYKYTTNNKVIGAVGDAISYITLKPDGVREVPSEAGAFGIDKDTVPFVRNYITYEKQVTSTSTVSIRVHALSSTTRVHPQQFRTTYNSTGSTTTNLDASTAAVVLSDLTSTEPLYIPINHTLLQKFSVRDRSEVLARAMSLIMYWRHVQVVKTGFFGSIFFKMLSIIIIAVAIYFGQAELAQYLGELGTMTAAEAFISVITDIVVSVGVSMALSKLAEVGGIFAVIAAVYMMYKFDIGGFGTLADGTAMPWAEQLMKAVTLTTSTMADAIGNATALGYAELLEDISRFDMSLKDKQEELDAAKDLLGGIDNMYNPLLVRYSTDHFVSTESPTAFYNRALNTNPGVAALSYISSYAAIGVSLPEWNGVYQVEVTPDSI